MGGIDMTEEAKKVLLEEFLPRMTCELLLHLNFFDKVIKDDKQSSEFVEKAEGSARLQPHGSDHDQRSGRAAGW